MVVDKVAYDAVPQAETGAAGRAESDPETGQGGMLLDVGQLAQLGVWAKSAAKSVRHQVAQTASQVAEHTKGLDESAKGWQTEVSKGFGRVAEGASLATAALGEKGKAAQQLAKDLGGKSKERLNEAKALGAAKAREAKEKAAAAAAGAKGALGQVGQSLSGLTALTMSPAKLAQFGGVFFLGIFLISMSFSFLPILMVAPQKFALLFAFGSMTLLGSFAILKGPQAFVSSLIQREKLPFSISYVVGLVGTLAATLVLRSYVLTAVFGLTQAVALLYFLASFVPGGKAILNFCGRICSKSARAVGGRLMRT